MAERQPTPVRVLGVSAHYHDSAAALVVNGEIVAAAQEERFTRRKGDADLPLNAMEYVLTAGGTDPGDLDAVVFYENPYAKLERQLATHLLGRPRSLPGFMTAMRASLSGKLWVQSDLRRFVGRNVPVLVGDHHLSHAASAFYPSPFHDAAIVTVDGVGEWSTTTVGHGRANQIDLVEQIEFPNSLGLLYSAFTVYTGFKVNSGEYKLMGLAPFGEPRYADLIRQEVLHLHDDGSFSMNPDLFDYFGGLRTYLPAFEQLFGAPTRQPETRLEPFHADVAASIQQVTNEAMLALARRARTQTGSSNLVLAGGVALNVVSVGEIERSGLFDNVWVQPAAGDAGGALGAALWATHMLHDVPRSVHAPADLARPASTTGSHTGTLRQLADGMRGAFLGPEPSDVGPSSEELVGQYGLHAETFDDDELAVRVANELAAGNIVGIARGRMEYGPRALGARSVLADARNPQMQSRLNLKTKFREGFRPFAPVVTVEAAQNWFEIQNESPYMLKTFPVRAEHRLSTTSDTVDPFERVKEQRSTIPAVTHVDFSARVQTVDGDRNPFLHRVLQRFEQLTGVPLLVNTSFNVRGEPIVCSAEDAIECFLATDIDVLVVDNHVITRTGQDGDALRPRRATAVQED